MPDLRNKKPTSTNETWWKWYPDSWAENAKKNWDEAFQNWKDSLAQEIVFKDTDYLKLEDSRSSKK